MSPRALPDIDPSIALAQAARDEGDRRRTAWRPALPARRGGTVARHGRSLAKFRIHAWAFVKMLMTMAGS